MKKPTIAIGFGVLLLVTTLLMGAAVKPSTVIHVVTVKWVDGTTREQIDAVFRSLEAMADEYPGIERVWLRSIKVQGTETGATHAFVMEFSSEQALADYDGSEAQQKWYEAYLPIRDQSRTFDITN